MTKIPREMKAVVYRGVDKMVVETIPVPRIGPREMLVRIGACGVCPTDIKKIKHGTMDPPRVFGHESAGVIVKKGALVRGFKVGDRLVGDEGYGPTVIELCYIGERRILAHTISHKELVYSQPMYREETWTLSVRDCELVKQ